MLPCMGSNIKVRKKSIELIQLEESFILQKTNYFFLSLIFFLINTWLFLNKGYFLAFTL